MPVQAFRTAAVHGVTCFGLLVSLLGFSLHEALMYARFLLYFLCGLVTCFLDWQFRTAGGLLAVFSIQDFDFSKFNFS